MISGNKFPFLIPLSMRKVEDLKGMLRRHKGDCSIEIEISTFGIFLAQFRLVGKASVNLIYKG